MKKIPHDLSFTSSITRYSITSLNFHCQTLQYALFGKQNKVIFGNKNGLTMRSWHGFNM